MSEDTLIKKITDEAETTVAEIKAAADAKVTEVETETQAMLAAAKTAHEALVAKEKVHLETVAFSKARQTANIAVQEAKRAGVNTVFESVFADFKDADSSAYVAFFAKAAKDSIPSDATGTALCPVGRTDDTKAILKELGIDASIIEDARVSAGLILDTDNGVFDASLDRIFSELRPKLEMEIIKKAL
jgi:vacuolar-type H+-ATPase subunit E/Vma4